MTDRAAMQLSQQISQIESRRRELMMQDTEVKTRLDGLRQEQVAKLGQLRHTEDRIGLLRASVQALQLSAASAREFVADAASRADKSRIEEPVLLRVAVDSRDAAKEELERWRKGAEGAAAASAAWNITAAGASSVSEKNNTNNTQNLASDDASFTSSTTTAAAATTATSSVCKNLQIQISLLDAEIGGAQQQEAACRAQAAKLAQATLQVRAAIKQATDTLNASPQQQIDHPHHHNQQNKSTTSSTASNSNRHNGGNVDSAEQQNSSEQKKSGGGGSGSSVDHIARLHREIEEADAKHTRQMAAPQREVDTLEERIKELAGWVADAKMQTAAATAAVDNLARRKALGLCSVCAP